MNTISCIERSTLVYSWCIYVPLLLTGYKGKECLHIQHPLTPRLQKVKLESKNDLS